MQQANLPSVGQEIKRLRMMRGLSLRRLADQADISAATLSRWETQKRTPSLPELDAVLNALGASPAQKRTLLHRMDATRSVHALRRFHEDATPLPFHVPFHGPRSSRADLLWAMRQRRGWTQAEAAWAAGVAQSQLARWENGDTWPDDQKLHALCWGLAASPEEAAALTNGADAFSPMPLRGVSQTWDEQAWDFYLANLLFERPSEAVLDLTCLAAEQQLMRRIEQNTVPHGFALSCLAKTYAIHARHHLFYKNTKPAMLWAERGMMVTEQLKGRLRAAESQAPVAAMPSLWFGNIVVMAEVIRLSQRTGPLKRAERHLRKWLPAVPPDDPHYAWGQMERCDVLVALGRGEEAVALGKTASEKAARIAWDEGSARWGQFAQILLAVAKPKQALAAIERSRNLSALGSPGMDSTKSPRFWLVEADCYTALGDLKSAEERVRWAEQTITEQGIGYLQDKLKSTVSRIERAAGGIHASGASSEPSPMS